MIAAARITHYSLNLPDNQTLTLNRTTGSFLHITIRDGRPHVQSEQLFPEGEMAFLLLLLDHYPHYVPYEVILAQFLYQETSEKFVETARRQLHEATEREDWELLLKPVRNIMSRTRLKLQRMRLDVRTIVEVGYLLSTHRLTKRAEVS